MLQVIDVVIKAANDFPIYTFCAYLPFCHQIYYLIVETLTDKASSQKEAEADPSVEDITYKLVQNATNKCEKLRLDNMVNQAYGKELFEAEQRLYRLQETFSKKVWFGFRQTYVFFFLL